MNESSAHHPVPHDHSNARLGLGGLGLLLGIGIIAGQLVRYRLGEGVGSAITLLDVTAAAYALAGAAAASSWRLPFPRSSSLALLGGFCLWLWVSLALNAALLINSEVLFAMLYMGRFFLLVGVLVVSAWLAGCATFRTILLTIFGASALCLLILGFLQFIFVPDISFLAKYGWDPHQGRLLSTFLDPNFFGMFLVMGFAVVLAALFERPSARQAGWLWLLLGFTGVAIVATLSRSAYLAWAVATLVILLLRSWRFALLALIGLAIVGAALPPIRERIVGAFTVDTTSQARIQSWQETLAIAQERPLVGVGYNALGPAKVRFGYLTDLSSQSAQGSDSSVLLVLATTGVVGLLLYLGFWALLGLESYALWRAGDVAWKRWLGLALMGIIPAYLVHSQFVNGLFYPLLFVPFALLAGTVIAQQRSSDSVAMNATRLR